MSINIRVAAIDKKKKATKRAGKNPLEGLKIEDVKLYVNEHSAGLSSEAMQLVTLLAVQLVLMQQEIGQLKERSSL